MPIHRRSGETVAIRGRLVPHLHPDYTESMDERKGLPRLPIGIQSFEVMRTDGFAYVDKTRFIARLVAAGKYYFLSRPRRFGKSLLVDTLDCAFSGRRKLFEGLWLASPESEWDWEQVCPVLRIDWTESAPKTPEAIDGAIGELFSLWEKRWGVYAPGASPGSRMSSLVQQLNTKTGAKVVVLVDEYDKPILDTLEDPALATAMRDRLRDLYGSLKSLDNYLEMVFVTGVSKFAKAGIFSGLNNLNDITLDAQWSALCGYREEDLDQVFGSWLAGRDRDTIRSWYNGYSWGGESVYNPFDILLFLDKGEYRSFWFETGTPTFLSKLMAEQTWSLPVLDSLSMGSEDLGSFDVGRMRLEPLLFQTGYLTVKSVSSSGTRGTRYRLGFPNREVMQAFAMLGLEVAGSSLARDTEERYRFADLVEAQDTTALRQALDTLFASIPYNWHVNNPIARYEGYWASVVYAWFAAVGWDMVAEDATNRGRVDLTVKTPTGIWLFEFKVKGIETGILRVAEEKRPMAQLLDRGYAQKYLADGRPLRLVGIVFDPERREIVDWELRDARQEGPG